MKYLIVLACLLGSTQSYANCDDALNAQPYYLTADLPDDQKADVLRGLSDSVKAAHERLDLAQFFARDEKSLEEIKSDRSTLMGKVGNYVILRRELSNQLKVGSENFLSGPFWKPTTRALIDTLDWMLGQLVGQDIVRLLGFENPQEPTPPLVRGVNIKVTLMKSQAEKDVENAQTARRTGQPVYDGDRYYHPAGGVYRATRSGTGIYPAHSVDAQGRHRIR